jgi:aminoimidazole riboside kinase
MKNQMQMAGALGIGDAMVDLFTKASELPSRGGNIWSTAVEMHSGGTTANVAANLSKLGIRSAFAGSVGNDPYGTFLIDEFKRIDVDVHQVYIKKGAYTGIVLAIIDDQGERTFIACARGASHIYLTEEIALNLIISKELVIHSSGVCLVEEPARTGLVAALRRAHENNNLVYFDPNLRLEGDYFADVIKKAQLEAISLSDVVLIGDNEIILLYPGCSVKDGAMQLLDIGAKLVVVKQGEKGASAFDREQEIVAPAFITNVVSTAGAGDSFDAGFIAARIRQLDIPDALEYANAVAAIKVSRQGSQSVPCHQEVMDFLALQGVLKTSK